MKYMLRRSLCMVALLVALMGTTACTNNKDPLNAPLEVENMQKTVKIQTQYGPIQFPSVLADNMRHVETTEGGIALEVFYMTSEHGEREVFRIYFGAPDMGEHLGYLTIDGKEISVTFALCDYSEDDFSNENDQILFSNMMAAFTVVTNSIMNDSRFSELKAIEQIDVQAVELRYWTVTLPENIHVEESADDNLYRADFYGIFGGENILLYSFQLGDQLLASVLGTYMVDDTAKPVSLEVSEFTQRDNWSEEDQIRLYNMMDTINDVIQAIMSNSEFSQYEQ